jgi:hypothetical protein
MVSGGETIETIHDIPGKETPATPSATNAEYSEPGSAELEVSRPDFQGPFLVTPK